jgi:hypothetical protein
MNGRRTLSGERANGDEKSIDQTEPGESLGAAPAIFIASRPAGVVAIGAGSARRRQCHRLALSDFNDI